MGQSRSRNDKPEATHALTSRRWQTHRTQEE